MYRLKGFAINDAAISNQPGQVARFGEISSDSLSYAKDKLIYGDRNRAAGTTLYVFSTSTSGVYTAPTTAVRNTVLSICHFLYNRSASNLITNDAYNLRQILTAEFASTANTFDVGVIVEESGRRMPERVTYKDNSISDLNEITIWFSDPSFSAQFDEYSVEVIPPIQPYNDFFLDPTLVKARLREYDIVSKINDVQMIRGEYPYTVLRTMMYEYYHPANQADRTPSYWHVVVYGQAGNNPDVIREAIVEHVLANSTYTREQWAEILPDLFKTTEFIFTPFWTKYSVPNHELQAGIYSPVINPRQVLPWIQRTARGTNYTDTYVTSRYELTFNIYKSIAMGVVGNPENRDGVTQFSNRFPQYMVVSNDSPDFNRMDQETREFSNILSRLLVAAESMDMYTPVPPGISRVIRDGVIYAVITYQNINYLVVSKASAVSLFAQPPVSSN